MIPARLAHNLWAAGGLGHRLRFRRATQDPGNTQAAILRKLLRRNAETRFGRAHRFSRLRSEADFREAVPLSDHDDYGEHLELIMRGTGAVLTRDPVTHLVPTSGSTSARKLIPWTTGLQREFNRAIGAWTSDLYRRFPDIKGGGAYWSVSPAIPEAVDPAAPIRIGFDDDTDYLDGLAGMVARSVMAVPSAVRQVTDIDTFRYLVLLHLVATRDLRLVSVWHPTFFSLLLDALPAQYESIIPAVRTGNIEPPGPVPASVLRQLQAGFHIDPCRARELADLDPFQPTSIWPRLALLSAWGDRGSPARDDLTRRFPDVPFQAKGLLATEAVVTIPFAGRTPLAVTSHFYEFLDRAGRSHLALELEKGRHYEVVVTTGGGLYRYRLGDRVEVVDFLDNTPCLRFAGRAGGVSDLRGEKLDPQFVDAVLDNLTAPLGHCLRFRLLAADPDCRPPGYILFLVTNRALDLDHLAARLEAALRGNPHYRLCRFLGQLGPARASVAAPESIDAYFAWRTARGQALGDIKPAVIDSGPGLLECFDAGTTSPASHSPQASPQTLPVEEQ